MHSHLDLIAREMVAQAVAGGADAIPVWNVPRGEFRAWRESGCGDRTPSEYRALCRRLFIEGVRAGVRVAPMRLTVAEVLGGLAGGGLDNTPQNRAAVVATAYLASPLAAAARHDWRCMTGEQVAEAWQAAWGERVAILPNRAALEMCEAASEEAAGATALHLAADSDFWSMYGVARTEPGTSFEVAPRWVWLEEYEGYWSPIADPREAAHVAFGAFPRDVRNPIH